MANIFVRGDLKKLGQKLISVCKHVDYTNTIANTKV